MQKETLRTRIYTSQSRIHTSTLRLGCHRYLEVGAYSEWSEQERMAWLIQELDSRRPLIPVSMPMGDQVRSAAPYLCEDSVSGAADSAC